MRHACIPQAPGWKAPGCSMPDDDCMPPFVGTRAIDLPTITSQASTAKASAAKASAAQALQISAPQKVDTPVAVNRI
jgi:hypothetical protein